MGLRDVCVNQSFTVVCENFVAHCLLYYSSEYESSEVKFTGAYGTLKCSKNYRHTAQDTLTRRSAVQRTSTALTVFVFGVR